MKLYECVDLAANVLGLEDTDYTDEMGRLLLSCANRVVDEIVTEYMPVESVETAEATDGMINYEDLGAVYDVIEVKKDGKKVDFSLRPMYIEVDEDGEYEVTVYKRIEELSLDDDVPVSLHLSPRVVSYGIVAEFYLMSGLYEDAVVYDRRFKDALNRLISGFGERKIKQRRWLL